jgi:N-acetylglucosamine kinase-like BadF-type ATPase
MYLGVDGGGTKTAFALVDGEGVLKASHVGASIDYLADGIAVARARLIEGIQATLAQQSLAPAGVAFAFFGLPAYGEDGESIGQLDAMPSELLDASHYRCGNDMVCSWAGSLACTDGISVIAGTGSMAYGEFAGRQARCGGWGELIGDEGSAYWIAREGMNLFSRMSDGRAARGPLHRLVRERFELTNDLYLCSRIYGAGADRRDAFAQFARLVNDAALAGDTAAAGIFTRGAKELVDCVIATRRALDPPATALLPVSHSGGVFNNVPAMVDAFRAGLTAAPQPFEYVRPQCPPAVGAALYAARIAGRPIPSAAVKRLQQQCESMDVLR